MLDTWIMGASYLYLGGKDHLGWTMEMIDAEDIVSRTPSQPE